MQPSGGPRVEGPGAGRISRGLGSIEGPGPVIVPKGSPALGGGCAQSDIGLTIEDPTVAPREGAMAKYDPLARHLRRRNGADVVMSFADVERVIKAMLPRSASRPAWWGNEQIAGSRHVQCRAWLDAGYEASLIAGEEKVRFRRKLSG